MLTRCWSALFLGILVSSAAAQETSLPKVVLVGDSIRMGYAPLVAKAPRRQGDRRQCKAERRGQWQRARNLDEWVIKEKPASFTSMRPARPEAQRQELPGALVEYEENLKTILARIHKETRAKIIFATSPPILDKLHAERKAGFDRFEDECRRTTCGGVAHETGRQCRSTICTSWRRRRQGNVNGRRRHALNAGRLRKDGAVVTTASP